MLIAFLEGPRFTPSGSNSKGERQSLVERGDAANRNRRVIAREYESKRGA